MPVYGSGGFTTYSLARLREQLGGWAAEGIGRVKMKIGADPAHDLERVRAARGAIGPGWSSSSTPTAPTTGSRRSPSPRRSPSWAWCWFEEPVSSDDLEGLRLLRDRAPAGMQIAAGEYGYDLVYFQHMLDAGAVDCLQADGTRCGGYSEFLRVGALCAARSLPFSAHTAPTLHVSVGCALASVVHLEYFYDHARIEQMLFEGAPSPRGGVLYPDLRAPGWGSSSAARTPSAMRCGSGWLIASGASSGFGFAPLPAGSTVPRRARPERSGRQGVPTDH